MAGSVFGGGQEADLPESGTDRSRVRERRGPDPLERRSDETAGGCPSNTPLQSSQSGENRRPDDSLPQGVFAVDWWEVSGLIQWDPDTSYRELERLRLLREECKAIRNTIPVNFPECAGLLHQRGIGSGQQSHLENRVEWAGGTIAFSGRDVTDRQLSNYYLKVPGASCLLVGVEEARRIAAGVIASLGGQIFDEWVRRIDLCFDLPHLCVRDELQSVFDRGQMLTTSRRWNAWDGVDGKTGFTVGQVGRLALKVYDKRLDSSRNQDATYHRAMIDRRWGGEEPDAALRIEYLIRRPWLKEHQLDRSEDVLGKLSDIVTKVTSFGPRPFFCLTSDVPDRNHKHQSRSRPHPLWASLVERFRQAAGQPQNGLQRKIQRGQISLRRSHQMVVGSLTSAGAHLGMPVENLKDGQEVLARLEAIVNPEPDYWSRRWEEKSRRCGTYESLVEFDVSKLERQPPRPPADE